MLHSLRVRLLLTLMLVVLVAVGTVALRASQITASELQRYVERDVERNQRLLDAVMRASNQHQRPEEKQALAEQIAATVGERIVVTGEQGVVLADSAHELTGQTLACDAALPAVILAMGPSHCFDQPIPEHFQVAERPAAGDILFLSVPFSTSIEPAPPAAINAMVGAFPAITIRRAQGAGLDPVEEAFISAVNRSLTVAALAAGLVALLLTALLSRRILGPVETLTAAARKLERGDLRQRVQVRSKDEIGELGRAFNAMADGLARLEQLRRNMVNDVAHELRTPLTNIRGYLEALRDGVSQPTPELIGSLHEEALLLNRLVDDLQDLALAEAGQLRLLRRFVDLATLIERAVVSLQPALAGKRLAVSVELPPDLPPLDADPERIGQVLRNVLGNAITHTPPGGAIGITARAEGDAVAVSVRDTGSGIAADDLPQIFERFFRADRSRARATGGAGLGLTIVRQLVEAHGGRVWAESEAGHGATFTFTLPIARPDEEDLIPTGMHQEHEPQSRKEL